MPSYDYICHDCSHEFESFQQMSAEVLRNCPKCGKDSLQRLIGTGAALVFKGSGFYETDYKNTSKTSDSSKEKPSESKPKNATEVKATASSNSA